MTGSEGTQAHPADARLGHEHRRRRQPAQGRHDRRRRRRSVPVFGTVAEAMKETGADVSVVFVPPAVRQGRGGSRRRRRRSPLVVVITEGIPVHDTAAFFTTRAAVRHDPDHRAELPRPDQPRASPTPASSRPTSPRPGRIGLVSKSGTLTYQMMYELRDIGFSTASASAATRSSAPRTSTAWRRSRTTRRPTRS